MENCCCSWGAAVSGEEPEFPCADCPKHPLTVMREDGVRCRRHGKLALAENAPE